MVRYLWQRLARICCWYVSSIEPPSLGLPWFFCNAFTIARAWFCLMQVFVTELGPVGIPTPERPHPLTGGQAPLTLGHEFCGRIKAVPEGDGSRWKVGQAVMVDPHVVCRQCLSCASGNDQMCSTLAFVGISDSRRGGGLSEYVVVEEDHIHPLPESVSLEYAAVIEPLAVGHHAAKMANTDLKGLDVLIVGGGPVGVGMISVLRAHGVGRLLLSEPTAARWRHAKDVVDRVIDPKTENVGDVCRGLTGGKGVDVVFDCAGVQPGLEAGIDALRNGGTLVNVAIWEQSVRCTQLPT